MCLYKQGKKRFQIRVADVKTAKKLDQQAKVTINRITNFQNSIKMLYQKNLSPAGKSRIVRYGIGGQKIEKYLKTQYQKSRFFPLTPWRDYSSEHNNNIFNILISGFYDPCPSFRQSFLQDFPFFTSYCSK